MQSGFVSASATHNNAVAPPNSSTDSNGRGYLWADKYKPRNVSEMCYPTYANRLKQWLIDWSANVKNDPAKAKRGALLSGPPGVGKTTAVHVVAKELGATVIEYNASDFRSKKSLHEQVSNVINNTVLGAQRFVLLMDEVDGCDMGGVTEVISMLKSTKTPILCTCNDRWHPKLRSLVNYVEDIKFSRPPCNLVSDWVCRRVLAYENVSLPAQILQDIIKKEGGDIRSILTNLQMWTMGQKRLDERTLTKCANSSFKNTDVGIFDAAEQFLLRQDRPKTFEELQTAFYSADLVDMFVQENYIHFSPTSTNPNSPNYAGDMNKHGDQWLDAVVSASRSLSESDKIQKAIFTEQNWSMANSHLLTGAVYPCAKVRGSYNSFLTGPAANFDRQRPIKFPSLLGQQSTAGKNTRLLALVSKEGQHPSKGYSGVAVDIATDYLPLGVAQNITYPLTNEAIFGPSAASSSGAPSPPPAAPTNEQKQAAAKKTIEFMDAYKLVRDDWDFVTEVIRFKKMTTMSNRTNSILLDLRYPKVSTFNPHLKHAINGKSVPRFEAGIATATKTTLTREFNKTHTMESSVRSVVGKAAAASAMGDTNTQTQGDDEDDGDDDNAKDGAAVAPAAAGGKKPGAKPAAKKAAAAPKAKAAKPKAATKRGRDDAVELDDE